MDNLSESNPYAGMTRSGKAWARGFLETSQLMAEAISDGDWDRALGWATVAAWQHEMLPTEAE